MDPRIAEIVEELLTIAQSSPQDLTWQTTYQTTEDLLDDLRDHAERAQLGDESRLPELRFALLPTGPLSEIAASSGWADTYLRLADLFDELYADPEASPDDTP